MLLIFDNLVEPTKGVHGVVVTHLLAKEELRVRFSLDAYLIFDLRFPIGDLRPRMSAGLRVLISSICNQKSAIKNLKLFRWVLCWYGKATVNRPDAGSIPAAGAFYVEGQADWRRHSVRSGASVKALRVQLSLLPPCVR